MKLRIRIPALLAADRKWPDMNLEERAEVCTWIVETCMIYGASLGTALGVAGIFANGQDDMCPDRRSTTKPLRSS